MQEQKKTYINKLGFIRDPFSSTNADKEEFLSKYFIAPDYFDDIWGEPDSPSPTIVFGPRGSGKTAQKSMIESKNEDIDTILTISYTEHDLSEFKSVDDITLDYHLEYLNRLLLVSVFASINGIDSFTLSSMFDMSKRQYLYKLAKRYIENTPFSFHKNAIRSLKTLEDYGIDVWESLSKPISMLVKTFTKSKGLEVDLSGIKSNKKDTVSNKENFAVILGYLKVLGFESIYVLVDKVDENDLTGGNNPEDSFKFIAPLLKNLEILETDGVAFKFFLWDELNSFYSQFGRPDRVFTYYLEWNDEQLIEMLNNRTKTFSDNKIQTFSSLLENEADLKKIVLFSQGSPRDCIRICKRIISEQERSNNSITSLTTRNVEKGIKIFIKEKCKEIIPDMQEISTIRKYSKTTVDLEMLVDRRLVYTEIQARDLLKKWIDYNILEKIGNRKQQVVGGDTKSYIQYVFKDIRIAKYACPNLTVEAFLSKKIKECNNCQRIYMRDFDLKEWICPRCTKKN